MYLVVIAKYINSPNPNPRNVPIAGLLNNNPTAIPINKNAGIIYCEFFNSSPPYVSLSYLDLIIKN